MSRICSIEGCDRGHHGKGFCFMHYHRWKRGAGAPMTAGFLMRPNSGPTIERLLLDIDVSDADACWHYAGRLNRDGYGEIGHNGVRYAKAHRVSYELFNGPIPLGLQVDHTCHNNDAACLGGDGCLHRRCVNPRHLEAVTHYENSGRSPHTFVGRGLRRDACSKGHEYTPENTYIKKVNGSRVCRTCMREHRAKYRAKMRQRVKGDAA